MFNRLRKHPYGALMGIFIVFIVVTWLGTARTYKKRIEEIEGGYQFRMSEYAADIQKYGRDIRGLSSELSAYGSPVDAVGFEKTKPVGYYVERLESYGEELERYGKKLQNELDGSRREVEAKAFGLFMPKTLEEMKRQEDRIRALELRALRYRGRMEQLDLELRACKMHEHHTLERQEWVRLRHEIRERCQKRIDELEEKLEEYTASEENL